MSNLSALSNSLVDISSVKRRVLSWDNVGKLNNVSGFCKAGEIFCFVCDTNLRKSIIREIIGQDVTKPSSAAGNITVNGKVQPLGYPFGCVLGWFDEYVLYRDLTVVETLNFYYGMRPDYSVGNKEVSSIINALNLTDKSDNFYYELRSFEKKLLLIGIELLCGNDCIIYDMVTSGLTLNEFELFIAAVRNVIAYLRDDIFMIFGVSEVTVTELEHIDAVQILYDARIPTTDRNQITQSYEDISECRMSDACEDKSYSLYLGGVSPLLDYVGTSFSAKFSQESSSQIPFDKNIESMDTRKKLNELGTVCVTPHDFSSAEWANYCSFSSRSSQFTVRRMEIPMCGVCKACKYLNSREYSKQNLHEVTSPINVESPAIRLAGISVTSTEYVSSGLTPYKYARDSLSMYRKSLIGASEVVGTGIIGKRVCWYYDRTADCESISIWCVRMLRQCMFVFKRMICIRWRNKESVLQVHIPAGVTSALVFAFTFYNLNYTEVGLTNRCAAMTTLPFGVIAMSSILFERDAMDRNLYVMDRNRNVYCPAFAILANIFIDMVIVKSPVPILCSAILYYPVNFKRTWHAFFVFTRALWFACFVFSAISRFCISFLLVSRKYLHNRISITVIALACVMVLYSGFILQHLWDLNHIHTLVRDFSVFFWACNIMYYNDIAGSQFSLATVTVNNSGFDPIITQEINITDLPGFCDRSINNGICTFCNATNEPGPFDNRRDNCTITIETNICDAGSPIQNNSLCDATNGINASTTIYVDGSELLLGLGIEYIPEYHALLSLRNYCLFYVFMAILISLAFHLDWSRKSWVSQLYHWWRGSDKPKGGKGKL